MTEPEAGDLIAVMSAGAYGAVQAGTYNSRLLVPEVLVKGGDWALVRPRRSYEELIGLDKVPDMRVVDLGRRHALARGEPGEAR